MPIDWSIANLSPHLGDLYCIMQEASDYGVDETELIDAYFSVTDSSHAVDNATWQIDIGALCWEIHVLRWIVEFGVNAVEEAKSWVPDIALSIRNIADRPTLHAKRNTC